MLHKPKRSNLNPKYFENTNICQLLTLHIFLIYKYFTYPNFEGVSYKLKIVLPMVIWVFLMKTFCILISHCIVIIELFK